MMGHQFVHLGLKLFRIGLYHLVNTLANNYDRNTYNPKKKKKKKMFIDDWRTSHLLTAAKLN